MKPVSEEELEEAEKEKKKKDTEENGSNEQNILESANEGEATLAGAVDIPFSGEDFATADTLANKILEVDAPRSGYRLHGYWSWSFIFWVTLSSCAVFIVLMVQFQILGCASTIIQLDPYLGLTSPTAYKDLFASGSNHVCGTYTKFSSYMSNNHYPHTPMTADHPCHLPEVPCSEYNSVYSLACVGTRPCNDTLVCAGATGAGSAYYGTDLYIEYLSCPDITESLTNAMYIHK